MIEYDRQAPLDKKLDTTDLKAPASAYVNRNPHDSPSNRPPPLFRNAAYTYNWLPRPFLA